MLPVFIFWFHRKLQAGSLLYDKYYIVKTEEFRGIQKWIKYGKILHVMTVIMEGNMKQKILGVITVTILVLVSLFGGYSLGKNTVGEKTSEPTLKGTTSVAVVNLDSGIIKNGTTHNYGTELLNKAGNSVVHASLEVARTDVENGDVGGYVIIPADFSESVDSVNSTADQAVLEYSISREIEPEAKEVVIEKINNLYRDMNKDLTHVYLSAILNSVYTVQNDAEKILENDKSDLAVLKTIEGSQVIQFVELPELKQTENTVTDLDLSEHYNANHSLVTDLESSYNDFLNAGQADIDLTKIQSETVNTKVNTMTTGMATVTTGVSGLSTAISDEKATTVDYSSWSDNIENVMKDYDVHIDSIITAGNSNIAALHTRLVIVAQEVGNLPGSGSTYTVLDPSMRDALATYVANELITMGAASWPVDEAGWESILKSAWNVNVPTYSLTGNRLSSPLALQNYQMNDPYKLEEVTTLLITDGETVEDYIKDQVSGILTQATTSRDDVIDKMETAHTGLASSTSSLSTAVTDVNTENDALSVSLNSITLPNYVDTGRVGSIVGQLDSNQAAIEGAVTGKVGEYMQFSMQSFTDAQENVMAMHESITKASEQTNNNLEAALTMAKQSREATSDENYGSLNSITQQLSHTKNGNISNERLLRHMTQPVVSQHNVIAKGIIDDVIDDANQVEETPLIMIYLPWIIGIIAILSIVIIVIQKIFERINNPKNA